MEGTTTYLDDFVERHGLAMDIERIDQNPNLIDPDSWDRDARHYMVTIRCDWRTLRVPYSQGSAIDHEPRLTDVLECLALDAQGIDALGMGAGFEHWAASYGFDSDSRKAERTYRQVAFQSRGLSRLLGADAYRELLEIQEIAEGL